MNQPRRIQLSRAKGWRMPENTVKVDRSTKWGNPFIVGKHGTREDCTREHARLLAGYVCLGPKAPPADEQRAYREYIAHNIFQLRGKNLACWCPPGAPCHADLLLTLANGENS